MLIVRKIRRRGRVVLRAPDGSTAVVRIVRLRGGVGVDVEIEAPADWQRRVERPGDPPPDLPGGDPV